MQPRNQLYTIQEALQWASSFLREAGTKDPRFEAELLLRHCLDMNRTTFLASLHERMAADALERLETLCKRRAAHEPIQYMLAEQEFYGRPFSVGPGVLIPRPETEILIEQILLRADQLWPAGEALQVTDVGTGSGAIALTLACERPDWQVTTIDLSAEAIAIAKRNSKRLGVDERVRFLQGDLLSPILQSGEQMDILVSNPPYIPSEDVDELDREVRDFEPRLALDGGEDGLDCYRQLCAQLPQILRPKALVGFEVGIYQAPVVADLLRASGAIDQVCVVADLAGIERVVLGWRG
ncbi:peptide chain release factor N(5)-glutamine methyltransferase [Brevibacillus fulvus]|uniref:Release factor glutamine methyltransferase n=1 Tax=Brevibacillus fulvus TaxID=1125967 RepID=A0A938XXX5_9BACL|nr:peptide chain release factor N(5)-glutamine methyltransferase [Brevibacillus fulvus]MBM7590199.1 release factor glutamine methyltransferase [Brevibacillus fulvus]